MCQHRPVDRQDLRPEVAAVVEAGRRAGLDVRPRSFPQGTRSAADAARAIGVAPDRIVKSLVFSVDGETVVALVSGAHRLDESKLARAAGGSRAWREEAERAKEVTGFPVGGVPPFGHRRLLRVFVDEDLLAHPEVWAAAGTSNDNFAVAPSALVRATGATVCDLARR